MICFTLFFIEELNTLNVPFIFVSIYDSTASYECGIAIRAARFITISQPFIFFSKKAESLISPKTLVYFLLYFLSRYSK